MKGVWKIYLHLYFGGYNLAHQHILCSIVCRPCPLGVGVGSGGVGWDGEGTRYFSLKHSVTEHGVVFKETWVLNSLYNSLFPVMNRLSFRTRSLKYGLIMVRLHLKCGTNKLCQSLRPIAMLKNPTFQGTPQCRKLFVKLSIIKKKRLCKSWKWPFLKVLSQFALYIATQGWKAAII